MWQLARWFHTRHARHTRHWQPGSSRRPVILMAVLVPGPHGHGQLHLRKTRRRRRSSTAVEAAASGTVDRGALPAAPVVRSHGRWSRPAAAVRRPSVGRRAPNAATSGRAATTATVASALTRSPSLGVLRSSIERTMGRRRAFQSIENHTGHREWQRSKHICSMHSASLCSRPREACLIPGCSRCAWDLGSGGRVFVPRLRGRMHAVPGGGPLDIGGRECH